MAVIDIGNGGIDVIGVGLEVNAPIQIDTGLVIVTRQVVVPAITGDIIITNPERDKYFYCQTVTYDFLTDTSKSGIIAIVSSLGADIQSRTLTLEPITIVTSLEGVFVQGKGFDAGITVGVEVGLGDWFITSNQRNWVAWSKIGDIRVIPDRTNEAGKRPMNWQGWAYKVMQLGKNAVIYGENGISVLYPVASPAATFGMKDLYFLGLLDKNSVAGDINIHFFIDSNGVLCKLTEKGVEKLGYEEFLLPLAGGRVVLLWDSLDQRLLISNGTVGYIYKEGLGGGYENITGIAQIGGDNLVTSPATVVVDPLNISTDIIDFGYRGIKTLTEVEIGTDNTEDLFVSVDYRYNKKTAFVSSPWKQVNQEGVAFPIISGIEFRINVKQNTRSDSVVDYLNIRYKVSDKRFLRGALSL